MSVASSRRLITCVFTSSFYAALFNVTTRVQDSGGDAEEPLEVVDRDRAVKDLKASSAKAILNEL